MRALHDTVCQAIQQSREKTLAHLMDFVRIPSVSAPGFDSGQVRASAEFARDLLAAAGLHRARLLEIEGAHPYVTAEWLGAASAPTILLYAHHDVQPPGRIERWSSDPFHPVERDGRLYGRGTADDKAGVVIHAAAIAAWLQATGDLPCNVKVLIEGEEEIGSGHLSRFLATYGPDLRADVMVLADAGNWAVGHPALTYSLRGLTELTVRVRTTRAPQHSGMFGGVLPDPVFALSKMLGALVDSKGRIAVPGLRDDVRDLTSLERDRLARLEFDEPTYRSNAGLLDGVELIGDTAIPAYQRLWFEPAISILAMDSHPIQGSSNQVLSEASARISVRLAPGQEPERVQTLLADSLSATAPWGVHVEIAPGTDSSPAWICEPKGPAFDAAIAALSAAFGKPPVFMGVGGSIPFVAPFAAAFGGIPVLLTGPADPTSRIHSEDESLHLGDWYNHIHAEAILFEEIAQRLRPRK